MADTSAGPVRTMPGSRSRPPAGMLCDDHPNVPAVVRIQGETDSFGCEYIDACNECDQRYTMLAPLFFSGMCELCRNFKETLKKWRDLDEGVAGRLYDACKECRESTNQELLQEANDAFEDRSIVSEMIQEHDPDPEDVVDAVAFDEEDGEPR